MKLEMNIVNAFTDQPFGGNSAAVIVLPRWLPEPLMQSIAAQNNLSETAYLVPHEEADYEIRWFSPLAEIAFCGHATLGAAFVLFSQQPTLAAITFYAKAVGLMTVSRGEDGYIQMDFPSRAPQPVAQVPAELLQGLSLPPVAVLRNDQAYFAVYEHEQDVLSVTQDSHSLRKLAPFDVVVTAPAEAYDFVSRYFWPANGGDEDPVTGSIHTGLAPFWAGRLGKKRLMACQASSRRGTLLCVVEGDRVFVSGKAVHYLEGHINVE